MIGKLNNFGNKVDNAFEDKQLGGMLPKTILSNDISNLIAVGDNRLAFRNVIATPPTNNDEAWLRTAPIDIRVVVQGFTKVKGE